MHQEFLERSLFLCTLFYGLKFSSSWEHKALRLLLDSSRRQAFGSLLLDSGMLMRDFAGLSWCKEQSKLWYRCFMFAHFTAFVVDKHPGRIDTLTHGAMSLTHKRSVLLARCLRCRWVFVLIICFAVNYQVFNQLCFPQTSSCPAEAMPAPSCLPLSSCARHPDVSETFNLQCNAIS